MQFFILVILKNIYVFNNKFINIPYKHKLSSIKETRYLEDLINNKTQNNLPHFEETTNDTYYLEDLMNNKTEDIFQSKILHFEEILNDIQYLKDLMNKDNYIV